ncbi:MAG: hypothetical protein EAZ95_15845, partial [Bacteroidetes bacterium]
QSLVVALVNNTNFCLKLKYLLEKGQPQGIAPTKNIFLYFSNIFRTYAKHILHSKKGEICITDGSSVRRRRSSASKYA